MNPVCPVFRRCGGCALLDMDYAAQLEAKRRRLEALLGGLVKLEGIEPAEEPLRYRTKVHAVLGRSRSGLMAGTYAAGTHRIVDSRGCLIEDARCREALEAALAGETVAVVSSGDAGVYGMAGLLMELTELERYRNIRIEVVPGVTAALAAAALAGAPLMNDFAVLSLSDLMTERTLIEKRLRAAAEADLPVALYNPASSKRHTLLEYAVKVFFEAGGALPGALVRDAFRPGQTVEFFTLDHFPFDRVQMTTLVLIGNSQTIRRGDQLYKFVDAQ